MAPHIALNVEGNLELLEDPAEDLVVSENLKLLEEDGDFEHLQHAYKVWETNVQEINARIEFETTKGGNIRNEIYQLLGVYAVIQGVLFTAVAQASLLDCRNWWTVFALSALASIFIITAAVQKLIVYWQIQRTIAAEAAKLAAREKYIHQVKHKGPTFVMVSTMIRKKLLQPRSDGLDLAPKSWQEQIALVYQLQHDLVKIQLEKQKEHRLLQEAFVEHTSQMEKAGSQEAYDESLSQNVKGPGRSSRLYIFSVITVLLAFSIIFLVAGQRILCIRRKP